MRPRYIASILTIIGLGGCDPCYNVACDEPNVGYINGLHFEFDKEQFPFASIDNAMVLRFGEGNLDQPLDTIFLKDIITNEERSFHIAPMADADGQAPHVYGIYDNSREYAYFVSNIATVGIYPTDCCCCYRNTLKTFVLNGESKDLSGTTDVVVLQK